MASSNNLSRGSIVLITGTIPQDLKPASIALAYFLGKSFQIQSSNLHGTTFLYTLVHQQRVYLQKTDYLKPLEETTRSAGFSITIA